MNKINTKSYLTELKFPIRTNGFIRDALMYHGIIKVKDLCLLTEEEAQKISIIKGRNLQAVKLALADLGLWLGMSREELREYEQSQATPKNYPTPTD